MKWLNSIKGFFRNVAGGTFSLSEANDFFFDGGSAAEGADISEITYFTCLKTVGEALGKMPVYLMDSDKNRVMQHETSRVLSVEPNSIMTPLQFFTTLERYRNHYGNGYAMIERDHSKLRALHILDPRLVQVWLNNTGSYTERRYFYRYSDPRTGKEHWIAPEDMLHVRAWLTDDTGLVGKSVRQILAENMAGNKASQKFLTELYRKGLTANAVVKYASDLNEQKQNEMLRRIEAQARKDSRRLITLPPGADIETLDLKLTDSQFYELKRYSALQVAAAFGVNPDHLNDYTKSSYNIATQVFFAADRRQIPANAYLMIHKPAVYAGGNADDLRKSAEVLDTIQRGLEEAYIKAARADVTAETIHQMVNEETWLTGKEAAEFFAVELLEASQMAACVGSAKFMQHIPEGVRRVSDIKPPEELPAAKAVEEGGCQKAAAEEKRCLLTAQEMRQRAEIALALAKGAMI